MAQVDIFENFFKEQREKDIKKLKEQIKEVICSYIRGYKSRQRQDLYDYLNKYYDLNLTAYDYDGRSDYAKIALQSEKWEYDYVVNKVSKELEKKI